MHSIKFYLTFNCPGNISTLSCIIIIQKKIVRLDCLSLVLSLVTIVFACRKSNQNKQNIVAEIVVIETH
jgi:hypothetical protein